MAAQKRKLNVLDLVKKKEIIDYIDCHRGIKMKEIALSFGIPASTLSTILKEKEKINEGFCTMSSKSKKMRPMTNESVDKCLLEWFRQVRCNFSNFLHLHCLF